MERMSARWVDGIHERLTVRYGEAFSRMYHGANPDAVRADWAETLAGISGERVKYALGNLPEKPPHAGQFRTLCMQAPIQTPQALPPPKPDAQFVGQIMQRLATVKAESSERLTPAQQCERNIYDAAALYNGGILTPAQKAMLKAMREAGQIAQEATE